LVEELSQANLPRKMMNTKSSREAELAGASGYLP
jgi:hypothetical protein